MKTRTRSLLRLLLTLGLCLPRGGFASTEAPVATDPPSHYVIGLSPFLDRTVKDAVFRQVLGLLLEDMPLGSSLGLYDAYNLQTIARIEIPVVSAFRSGKTRANQFKAQIRKLKTFLATDHPRPAAGRLNFDQAVRLPQFMDFVGGNPLPPDAGASAIVILLGGPLYLDPKEPGFSMLDGYFPSDGHLLAAREDSVFGLKSRAGTLDGVTVHWAYFGDPWVSDVHEEKIRRFWTLFLRGQGGRLATFCGDLATVFEAARNGGDPAEPRVARFEPDPRQTKLEMLRVTRDVGVADWITRDTPLNLAQHPPATTVGPMKIGIRWRGNIDLDLYAAPEPGAETLYFEHMRSPQGYYFKDHRSSPQREYEFIEFESPVDVWRVDARINFYEGSLPRGASGDVRIEFDGRVYAGHFELSARSGNQGRTGSGQEAYWTRIDVPDLLKLTEPRRTAAAIPRQ